MSDVQVIQLRKDGEPQRPNRSVRQLAEHLKLDFAPANLPLSMISLARRFEELEHRVKVLEFQLSRPLWRRLAAALKRSGER